MKIALIAAAVVLALGGGGAGAWFYFRSTQAPMAADDPQAVAAASADENPIYIGLDPPFVANFNINDEPRFAQVSVELLTHDKDVAETVKLHMPRIRDSFLMLLTGQQFEKLNTREAKEKLREETRTEIDAILMDVSGQRGIAAVYFTAFVMQ